MDSFVIVCFAIPITSFVYSIAKTNGYVQGREESEVYMVKPVTWKRRDGSIMEIADMTNQHLANSVKMLCRLWKGKVHSSKKFKELYKEAKKRKFQIFIHTSPIIINGREEYADVLIFSNIRDISISIIPYAWGDRPQD